MGGAAAAGRSALAAAAAWLLLLLLSSGAAAATTAGGQLSRYLPPGAVTHSGGTRIHAANPSERLRGGSAAGPPPEGDPATADLRAVWDWAVQRGATLAARLAAAALSVEAGDGGGSDRGTPPRQAPVTPATTLNSATPPPRAPSVAPSARSASARRRRRPVPPPRRGFRWGSDSSARGPDNDDAARRWRKATLAAWGLSEVFDRIGLLAPGDEAANKLRALERRLRPILADCRDRLRLWRRAAEVWYRRAAAEVRARWEGRPSAAELWAAVPRRYRWAAGAALGFLLAPAAARALTTTLLPLGLVLYVAAVLNEAHWRRSTTWRELLEAAPEGGLLRVLDGLLTDWRDLVDAAIADPRQVLEELTAAAAGVVPIHVQYGVLSGLALGWLWPV